MEDLTKRIMKLQNRTALELFQWMKARGFEFRSGFSHLSFDYVLLKYLEGVEAEDARQRSADNGGTQDAGQENQVDP